MDEGSLPDCLREYDQLMQDGKSPSLSWLSKLLKEIRKSKIRRPDISLTWGPKVLHLENYIEVWNLQEQIAVAAIELGDLATAESILEKLKVQFPNSSRVQRVQGMLLESQGKFADALVLYNTLLKENVSDVFTRKRKVCVYKAQNNFTKMIEEINQILNFFPSDLGSWLELGELYLLMNDYEGAKHCYEEIILLDSRNAHFHCRLAEIFYSMGGTEKILLARKYFTISLSIQAIEFNLRALSGLILACKQLKLLGKTASLESKKKLTTTPDAPSVSPTTTQLNEHELKVNEELLKWSESELERYLSQTNSLEQVRQLKAIVEK